MVKGLVLLDKPLVTGVFAAVSATSTEGVSVVVPNCPKISTAALS